MKKSNIIFATAAFGLSVTGFSGVAHAEAEPLGHKFCINGIPEVSIFRANVDKSIAADPSGNRSVQGCLATPTLFVQAILIDNPKASVNGQPLTASNLSAYMGKLVVETLEQDTMVQSSYLWEVNGGYAVKLTNEPRELYKGEKVLRDPDTGVRVMMTGCANPNVVITPPIKVTASPCVKVKYPPLLKAAAIRIAYVGPEALPNKCFKNSIGNVESDVFPQECPKTYKKTLPSGQVVDVSCDWRLVEQRVTKVLGKKSQVQNLSYSYYARSTQGQDWVLLPIQVKDGVVSICWELLDGTIVTLGVTGGAAGTADDYVKSEDGSLPATATVTENDARTIGTVH